MLLSHPHAGHRLPIAVHRTARVVHPGLKDHLQYLVAAVHRHADFSGPARFSEACKFAQLQRKNPLLPNSFRSLTYRNRADSFVSTFAGRGSSDVHHHTLAIAPYYPKNRVNFLSTTYTCSMPQLSFHIYSLPYAVLSCFTQHGLLSIISALNNGTAVAHAIYRTRTSSIGVVMDVAGVKGKDNLRVWSKSEASILVS